MTTAVAPAPQWTDAFLDEMHRTGESVSDRAIARLFEQADVKGVTDVLQHFIAHDGLDFPDGTLNPALVEIIEDYRRESSVPPPWPIDWKQIHMGEELFRCHGMIAFSMLGCASLPELYCCGQGGTQVLEATLKLEDHVARRVYETSRFLIAVMSRDGLKPGGNGIAAAQKVRLMHAAVRFLIMTDRRKGQPRASAAPAKPALFSDALRAYENWDKEKWGVPIGQEYMGGTVTTFSYVILRGMRQLGIDVGQATEEAYIHSWNVVGHYMGVDPRFLEGVRTYADAEALFDRVMQRRQSRTPEEAAPGVALTAAVVRYMGGLIAQESLLGRNTPLRHVPKLLIRTFLAPERADLLGVRLSLWETLMMLPWQLCLRIWGIVAQRASEHHMIAHWLFKKIAKAVQDMPRAGGNRPPFEIPEELADGWGIRRPAAR